MNWLIKGVIGIGKVMRACTMKDTIPLWKRLKFGPPPHGDFRPELLQEVSIFHFHMGYYQKWTDSVRVRMATRKMEIEENTRYVPTIYNIVAQKCKDKDISNMRLSDVYLNEILSDLSYNIFLKEHRLRYQPEQKIRHVNAFRKFKSKMYTWRNPTLDQFVKDYNKFLWFEINKSNLFISPKIEANYRRNYHEGEVSPITSIIFYLYFKTDKVKRFFSKLLLATYRNPYSDKRNKIIV